MKTGFLIIERPFSFINKNSCRIIIIIIIIIVVVLFFWPLQLSRFLQLFLFLFSFLFRSAHLITCVLHKKASEKVPSRKSPDLGKKTGIMNLTLPRRTYVIRSFALNFRVEQRLPSIKTMIISQPLTSSWKIGLKKNTSKCRLIRRAFVIFSAAFFCKNN